MIAQPGTMTFAREHGRDRRDLLETVLVISALIALLNLPVLRAFTVYDLVTALIALLIIGGPRRLRSIPSSLRLAGLLLLLAGLVSAFRSTYAMEAVYQVLQYAFVFFVQLPVILTLARSRATVHAALMMFILGYLVVVVIAVMTERDGVGGRVGRVLPFYNEENPNALAIPTAFLTPFVLYFALDQWRRRRRFLVMVAGGAVLCLMVWALTASGSRGSVVATIVSLAVFVAFSHGLELSWKVLVRIGVVLLVVATIGVAVYSTNFFPDTLESRIGRTVGSQEAGAITDDRVALDRAGIRAFLESPLIGTGFNNFRYVAQFYDDGATLHEPHNLWIQFLAQAGLVGAAAFLFIIVRWFILLFRIQAASSSRSLRELLWAFIAAMAGILTHGMVSPLLLQRHYWLLYGLGIVAAVELPREIEGMRSGGPWDRPFTGASGT